MFVLVGGVVMLVISNVLCQSGESREENADRRSHYNGPQLPDSFVDVFKPGLGGRPTRGTTHSTCWARGGICVKINSCRSFNMDVGVAGCSRSYMVCCKVHVPLSPTVGSARKDSIPLVNSLDELGTPLDIIALRNSMLLTNWQSEKPKSEVTINVLGDLLKK